MRTFEYSDASSHKFWNIELQGKSFTVTYGRIGSKGQTQTKKFADEARAQKEHDKLVQEKQSKGYRETTPSTKQPSLREALEAAILEHPEERANYAAYADFLTEQGDPQGEFIQVQLALEDESRPAAERKKLKQREKALLKKHQAEWVGDWAGRDEEEEEVYGPDSGQTDLPGPKPFQFERGILAGVSIGELTVERARALVRAPQTRLVRRL